ncbi:antibiotic biosynthesis monooxygenase [Thermincola ferriacetica]|uniref:Antibiotic biosynthesis monooxygenase n=2 Tax=Thermincola TaxID=278993 RepID=D5X8A6_THEPJ|nr:MULTISPECIES: antibiotic biosynthesis monooxygenase family protein [Thermincola]ADG82826.1 Antibiotic biosynthesis monooxygenase [Thermincola potens JR]KNZ69694.1 antibiotic biosynthesis monooxygenase [Thermincola ferriacetica]
MIISIGRLVFKPGMEAKGLETVFENSALGAEQKGCLEATVLQNLDNPAEVLLISKWQDQVSYSNAITNLKRDPKARRLFLKVLPQLEKQPTYASYKILPT